MTTKMTHGQLNKIMDEAGVRQLDLSHMLDVTTRQVRRWQTGHAIIPTPVVVLMRLLAWGTLTADQIDEAKRKAKR